MSSIGEQRGASRVRLRRPPVLDPTPPASSGAARRDPLWTAATLSFVAVLPLAGALARRHPEWPWPTIGQTGFVVGMAAVAAAIVIAWRQGAASARRALAASDGDAD